METIAQEAKHSIRHSKKSAWIQFWNDDAVKNDPFGKPSALTHFRIYQSCIYTLKKIGFTISKHPRYEEHYKILSPSHRYGIWKGLEVNIEIFARGFKFEFYQNISTGDRQKGDGEYCFNKYHLMDYLMRKRYDLSISRIIETIQKNCSASVDHIDRPVNAIECILKHCQNNHWKSGNPKELADIDNLVREYDRQRNSTDRDNKQIISGQVKYFRDYNGRLVRGMVYHNINNMWWVLINDFKYSNEAAFRLFDATAEDFNARRLKKHKIPEKKQKELDYLKGIPTGTLVKLLAKRSRKSDMIAAGY